MIAMTDVPHVSRSTLAVCLLASVALHGLLLVLLPGWRLAAPVAEVPPVLDVVMVAADAPPVIVPPAAPPPRAVPAPRPVKPVAAPPRQAAPLPAAVATPETVDSAAPPAPPSPLAGDARIVPRNDAPAIPAPPPVAVTPPAFNAAYLRNPPPAYPAAARRSGEEGTVMLRVLVGRDGAPLKVELDRSSGSRTLDSTALDAVKGWRFVPARRGTEAIEDWVRVPVVFRMAS